LQTVVGKLLTVGTLTSLIVGCSYREPYYGYETTADRTNSRKNVVHLLFFQRQEHNALSVPKDDRKRHERCVFFALEQLDLGQKCKWFSNTTGHKGEVRVVQVYPSGSKVCHVFYTTLWHNTNSKNWQDTACYNALHDKWDWISES